jgi:hypothetical protein
MSIEFEVKKQVVCINAEHGKRFPWEILPILNTIYTIRSIEVHPDGEIGLFLEEIVNKPYQYCDSFGEISFNASRFKPVKLTNIDVFTEILNPSPTKEKEKKKELEYEH